MEEKKVTSFWNEYGKYLVVGAGIIFTSYMIGYRKGYRKVFKDVNGLFEIFEN